MGMEEINRLRYTIERKKKKTEWKEGDERAHPREKSKTALLRPSRNTDNWIKNRKKKIAHNLLTPSDEALCSGFF